MQLQGPDAVQFAEPVLNLPLSSAYKRNASHVVSARLMAVEQLPSDKTALSLLQLGLFPFPSQVKEVFISVFSGDLSVLS